MEYKEIKFPLGEIKKIPMQGDEIFEFVKTIEDALVIGKELYPDLYNKVINSTTDYTRDLYTYRLIVTILTHNKKNYLTKGRCYYPDVQFYKIDTTNSFIGSMSFVVGYIVADGIRFTVVTRVSTIINNGIGGYSKTWELSGSNPCIGFFAIPSRTATEHIAKYFGKLIFNLTFSESNCDWKWIKI